MSKNLIQKLQILLSLTGILLFFSSALVTVYWLDDFWMLLELAEKGLWGTVEFFYFYWDGRALSPLFTFRNLVLWLVPYNKAYLAILPSLLSLGLTAYYMFYLLAGHESKMGIEKLVLISLLAFGLWMGFAIHMSTTIYWATGSYYVYANLLAVLTFYYLIKKPDAVVLNSIVLISLALSGVNLGLMLGFFLLANLKLKITTISTSHFWIYFSIFLLALILVVGAPGNFERAGGKLDFTVSSLLINYFDTVQNFVFRSRWILGLPLFLALVLAPTSENLGKMSLLFFGLAFVYLVPFAALEDSATVRTAITFQTMLFLGCYYVYAFFLNFLKIRFPRKIIPFGILIILGYFHWVIIRQLVLGFDVKKQVDERYSFLESNRGRDENITLKNLKIDSRIYINAIFDLSEDPGYPFNRYTSSFFSVGEVTISKNQ